MMTTTEILKTEHYLFASEVINGLNRLYGIPIELPTPSADDHFFNNDIRWGIATICYLFRKDFFIIFSKLKESLKNEKEFKKCCMLISVPKNDLYFFNFLRRVALIYEIALYCHRNGSNYFIRARNCIERYQDKVYFQSAGSWPRLTQTASFLRELGNPFLILILEESRFRKPLRLAATIERLEKRLEKKDCMCILSSKEMCFLMQQKEKFTTRTQKNLQLEQDEKGADSHTEQERAFCQCLESFSSTTSIDTPDEASIMKEKELIIGYLGSLLFSKVSNAFQKKKISSNRATDLNKSLNKHFQSHPNSDDQSKERESSSIKNDEIPLDIKYLSLQERLSDKSKVEQTEANKLKFNEEDLISEGSSSSDENVHLDYINNYLLPFKSMIYSSMESITSGSLVFSNINSSGNESNSLELHQKECVPECSSEVENAQHNRNQNKYLDKRNQHSSTTNSYTESSSSEFENTESDVEYLMDLFEEGIENRTSQLLDIYNSSENEPVKRSTVSDKNHYKKRKGIKRRKGNNNPKSYKNAMLDSKIMFNLSSLTGAFNEAPRSFRVSLTKLVSVPLKRTADTSETITTSETVITSETVALTSETVADTSEAVADTSETVALTSEAVADTSEAVADTSETNLNTNVANSQPQQIGGKRSRRKRKGKRK